MSPLVPLALLLLSGCPDPSTAPPADLSQPGQDAQPGADGAPPSGAGGAGGAAHTVDATVAPGEGVLLSGSIAYEGEKTGRIRIDVLTTRDNNPHLLAKTLELPAMGDWSIELPKDFGAVNVVGFLDQTGDGPTPDDPAMALPEALQIADEPIEGLALVLSDDPELGLLTPGGPPPEPGAEPVPDGQGAAVDRPIVGGPGDPGGPDGAKPEAQPGDALEAVAEPPAAEPQPEGDAGPAPAEAQP